MRESIGRKRGFVGGIDDRQIITVSHLIVDDRIAASCAIAEGHARRDGDQPCAGGRSYVQRCAIRGSLYLKERAVICANQTPHDAVRGNAWCALCRENIAWPGCERDAARPTSQENRKTYRNSATRPFH